MITLSTLMPAGTGTRRGIVNFAGHSAETTVAAHTIESVWLVNVSFTCLPAAFTASISISNHFGSPFTTLAPLFQSKVIKSSRKHGLVALFTTSKPNASGWSEWISKYTSLASTLLYARSKRASSWMSRPNTFGAKAPISKPAGTGMVRVAPVVYWQSVTIPIVTCARLLPLLAK